MTRMLTMSEAVEIVKSGRVGQDERGRLTVDGSVIRAPRVARLLTNAAIARWLTA